MPCADSFNDIHEIKCGQAEEKLEAGGDEKLIFNFIWPKAIIFTFTWEADQLSKLNKFYDNSSDDCCNYLMG